MQQKMFGKSHQCQGVKCSDWLSSQPDFLDIFYPPLEPPPPQDFDETSETDPDAETEEQIPADAVPAPIVYPGSADESWRS